MFEDGRTHIAARSLASAWLMMTFTGNIMQAVADPAGIGGHPSGEPLRLALPRAWRQRPFTD
jgi:hypothetical protein